MSDTYLYLVELTKEKNNKNNTTYEEDVKKKENRYFRG